MNPHVSPYFKEDFYKGQDVVHRGIRIPLKRNTRDETFAKLSRRATRLITEYEETKTFDIVALEEKHLPELRKLWFDPDDDTFPTSLRSHMGLVAEKDGITIGGILLSPSGHNLFLHQLISSEEGKKLGVPTILVWKAYEKFKDSWYNSIDIGVSYNPKRYEFFKNFEVETYPIILKKPFYTPTIRLSPFRGFSDRRSVGAKPLPEGSTFLPRGVYALYALLKHLNLQRTDTVLIVKTFGSKYIAACVTDTIEKVCSWQLLKEAETFPESTKAVLIIHEFGIACDKLSQENVVALKEKGISIIEDCAWRVDRALTYSDYQVFSYQKMYEVNYGGLLMGVHLSDDYLWSIGCLDVFKRERMFSIERITDPGADRRRLNWLYYYQLLSDDGMDIDDCYNYLDAVTAEKWMPTVFLQKVPSEDDAKKLVERLQNFGIQAGVYWGESVIFLPIHQNMTYTEVEYMFSIVKGYFNLCADYAGHKNTIEHETS